MLPGVLVTPSTTCAVGRRPTRAPHLNPRGHESLSWDVQTDEPAIVTISGLLLRR